MLRYIRQDDRIFLDEQKAPALLKSLENFLATKIA
jgi:hypothetical protein